MADPMGNQDGSNNDQLSMEELRANLPPSRAAATPDTEALKALEDAAKLLQETDKALAPKPKKPKFVRNPKTGLYTRKVWHNGKYVPERNFAPPGTMRRDLTKENEKTGQQGKDNQGTEQPALGQAKTAEAANGNEKNVTEPVPKMVEIKVEGNLEAVVGPSRQFVRKRALYYDYQPPSKVPTVSFEQLYGKVFDDAAKRDPAVFQPFMGYLREYFKGEEDWSEFMRGPEAVEIRDLFTGISVYNGVTRAPATNVQVSRVRSDYWSPYDSRITLKEHLGRIYDKHFDAQMPLLYVNGQIWPVEAIYCYRHQMPDTSTRIYRPRPVSNQHGRGGFGARGGFGGRGGFGARGGFGGRGRAHSGYGVIVRGRTGPHLYGAQQ